MSRMMLMQSILGHMALLAEKYPKKAKSPLVKRAKRAVKQSLQLKMHAPRSTTTTTTLRKAA